MAKLYRINARAKTPKPHERYGFLKRHQREAYDFCFFVHDELVQLIKTGEQEVFTQNIKIKEEHSLPDGFTGDDLADWLEENGYNEDILSAYYKQSIIALLSDFLHFIYESLQCAKKLKITVAFSLIRKPIKENLLYLEWILAEPNSFLHYMKSSDSKPIPPVESFSPAKKLEIIEKAIEISGNKYIPSPTYLYDIRYSKNYEYGLEHLCQKATHLITTFRNYKTESQNFNFIFSSEDLRYEQIDALLKTLPLILVHSFFVVNEIVSQFGEWSDIDYLKKTEYRIAIGFSFLFSSLSLFEKDHTMSFVRKARKFSFDCPKCGAKMNFGKKRLREWYFFGCISCNKCNWIESVYDNADL